jgi:hypothetical protein
MLKLKNTGYRGGEEKIKLFIWYLACNTAEQLKA